MLDLCNDLGVDTIDVGNTIAMAIEMTEQGKLDELDDGLEWGDVETMIDLIEMIAHRETELADHLAEGPDHLAEEFDAHTNSLRSKARPSPATTRVR